jgi:hypothetical protein
MVMYGNWTIVECCSNRVKSIHITYYLSPSYQAPKIRSCSITSSYNPDVFDSLRCVYILVLNVSDVLWFLVTILLYSSTPLSAIIS